MRKDSVRNRAQRLRMAVDALPTRSKIGMLEGIRTNRIIVGAYVDSDSGGICPMLAAHRNGGRTDLACFARAWDGYTRARKPRRATKREVRTLRSLLEMSLINARLGEESVTTLAAQIRAEREQFAAIAAASRIDAALEARLAAPAAPKRDRPRDETGERFRGNELRDRSRWSWMLPTRDYDVFRRRLAALEGARAEELAAEHFSAGDDALTRHRAQSAPVGE